MRWFGLVILVGTVVLAPSASAAEEIGTSYIKAKIQETDNDPSNLCASHMVDHGEQDAETFQADATSLENTLIAAVVLTFDIADNGSDFAECSIWTNVNYEDQQPNNQGQRQTNCWNVLLDPIVDDPLQYNAATAIDSGIDTSTCVAYAD